VFTGEAPGSDGSRFAQKRQEIIAAATVILNEHGVRGMTLKTVAAKVGLITNSVTYYFKRKDDLAVACYLAGIARYKTLANQALEADDPPARVRRFIDLYFLLERRVRAGAEPPLPALGSIRALPQAARREVGRAYIEFFGAVRDLFRGAGYEWMGTRGRTVRALLLLEAIYWSAVWLPQYDTEDLERVAERMYDLVANGVSKPGAAWEPHDLPPFCATPADKQARARETYLRAATRLINRDGYRGVSVGEISAELNLTKGAFYHHHDAKDDLIVACFERTFEVMRRMQHLAVERSATRWDALASVATALIDHQLSDQGPLMRLAALNALPEDIRDDVVKRSDSISLRFAAMISDGVAEGSLRPVDSTIAAQMIHSLLNTAAELDGWVADLDRARAARLFARPMLMGVFTH
jgi:AcrR family transcriptional regulator